MARPGAGPAQLIALTVEPEFRGEGPKRVRLAFVAAHMRAGGAERAVLNWLTELDRSRFDPLLVVRQRDGAFLRLVPTDVPVFDLGGRRALLLPRPLRRLLEAQRVDAVYAITNAMNLALLRAWPPRTRRPVRLVSEHTPLASYLAEAKWPVLRRAMIRHHYRHADAILVPSEAVVDSLRNGLGEQGLRLSTVPNPLTTGAALPRQASRGDPPLILAAGRLVAAKGFADVIAAAAILRDSGRAFRVEIHGEGPLHDSLQADIARRGLQDLVRLAGHSADLAVDLARADLFVLSSVREGFGNVIVEAQAAGIPVIATRCGGPETIISDGVTGFLVAPGAPAALAARIAGLLDDPDEAQRVRIPAFAATARWRIDASTRAFEAAVTEALAAARRGDP